jgi:hypothetical protein
LFDGLKERKGYRFSGYGRVLLVEQTDEVLEKMLEEEWCVLRLLAIGSSERRD